MVFDPAAELPALDVLIYPGGKGTRPHLRDEEQLAWVRAQRATVPLRLASVERAQQVRRGIQYDPEPPV